MTDHRAWLEWELKGQEDKNWNQVSIKAIKEP